jgi:hypothetical protein
MACPYRGSVKSEVDVMLRILHEAQPGERATLRLEGSVGTEWAALLERECFVLLRAGASVRLDLGRVGFVDCVGIDVLRRLGRAGVEVRCCPGTVASVLEAEGVPVTFVPAVDGECTDTKSMLHDRPWRKETRS